MTRIILTRAVLVVAIWTDVACGLGPSIGNTYTGRGRGRGRAYKHFGPAQYNDEYWDNLLRIPDIPMDPRDLKWTHDKQKAPRNKFGYFYPGPPPGGANQFGRAMGPGIPPPTLDGNIARPWYMGGGSFGPQRKIGTDNWWSGGQYRMGSSHYPNTAPAASPFLFVPPPLQGDWYMPKNPPPSPLIVAEA